MALGHVPLAELISQLVRDYGRRHSQIAFSFNAEAVQRSYNDSVDLTVYRCTQESLTNAVRHAQARHIAVQLKHVETERQLTLTVRDDGCGMYPGKVAGFGMRGMQERVEALAGCYAVDSQAGAGTCVRVTLPLAAVGCVAANCSTPQAVST
jgi:two-component system sensor histidine kinase UhpB